MNAIQTEARNLMNAIETGWDESMFSEIEENAEELGLCPADIGMLYHHMHGTDDVRGKVLAMLEKLAA